MKLFGKRFCEWPKYPLQRMSMMPKQLLSLNADIICLQEVWKKDQQEFFTQKLNADFPYVFTSEVRRFSRHSGLMIFSKYPLSNCMFHSFSSNTFDEWLFTDKGFLHVEVDHPTFGKVSVSNTHLVASGAFDIQDSKRIIRLRERQLSEIYSFYGSVNEPIILSGDMNFCTTVAVKNYQSVLEQEFIDSFDVNLQEVSWDPNNFLNVCGPYATSSAQKPDHVFYKGFDQKLQVKSAIVLNEEIVNVDGKKVPLSDHFGLLCEFS